MLRRYGAPARRRHSIQIEVNRQIYMDEETLAIKPGGMARLRHDLQDLVRRLLATDPR